MPAETSLDRRTFLGRTLAAVGATALGGATALAADQPGRLGMFVSLDGKSAAEALQPVRELGFGYCEIYLNSFPAALADELVKVTSESGIRVTALFASGPGPQVYDFHEGPSTIGLVPREWRAQRVAALKAASDFAKRCGIPALETHCGFISEDPKDARYAETVTAVREVAGHCRANGQTFLYHAGQETPVTLLRTIQDVGLDNQGVGLDTANLIMCGKGHPLDALDVYGRQVKAVNAKDGLFPEDTRHLGRETPLGQGRVDFARVLRRLKELDYRAPIIIEREVSGPALIPDLRAGKAFLEGILSRLDSPVVSRNLRG